MLEYHIDFSGQQRAERITQSVVSAFSVIGFLIGIFLQDIRLVIPAWPYLNKNPIQWLPKTEKLATEAAAQEQSGKDASL
ncbi:Signal peptidase complex subunit 1 [Actinomortierella wolfii]|nr:Signal peptidase complex subunit 1 [Actinomortierella wolfii]